jgi:uncharacterized DUF497 family protein
MQNTAVDVESDLEKAVANLAKHWVSFAGAEQARRDPQAATFDDPDATDGPRFVTFGCDSLGRLLVVVHVDREARVRLLSAREASRGTERYYHA